jgi:hypothetical protein
LAWVSARSRSNSLIFRQRHKCLRMFYLRTASLKN